MALSYANYHKMNMFGFGASPMFMPMTYGYGHSHCYSPMDNYLSLFTTMAVTSAVMKSALGLINPTQNLKSSQKQNNNFYNPFASYTMPMYNFSFVPQFTYMPTIPPVKLEFKPMKFTVPKFDFKAKAPAKTVRTNTYTGQRPSTVTSIANVAKIYDPEKGKKLAQAAIDGLSTADKGYCARAVKTAIEKTGLGAYESGHACDMPSILGRNANFKEVKVSASDLDNLPAGCVLCYPPGDCGYDAVVGHTEFTDGNGNGFHFTQTRNIRQSDNVRVFVPV